jgi:hypothetical protein
VWWGTRPASSGQSSAAAAGGCGVLGVGDDRGEGGFGRWQDRCRKIWTAGDGSIATVRAVSVACDSNMQLQCIPAASTANVGRVGLALLL